MELVLLKKDYNIDKIKLENEEVFQHLEDFLFYVVKKFCIFSII